MGFYMIETKPMPNKYSFHKKTLFVTFSRKANENTKVFDQRTHTVFANGKKITGENDEVIIGGLSVIPFLLFDFSTYFVRWTKTTTTRPSLPQ